MHWENGKHKRIDYFKDGKFIKGQCFDPQGNPTAHADFEVMPEAMPEFPGGSTGVHAISE
jgi:hypothetical protein